MLWCAQYRSHNYDCFYSIISISWIKNTWWRTSRVQSRRLCHRGFAPKWAKISRRVTRFILLYASYSDWRIPCRCYSAETTPTAHYLLICSTMVAAAAGQSTASIGSALPNLSEFLISVAFRNEGHGMHHVLWLMPAPGWYQSVNNCTFVSGLLAGWRTSPVNSCPTAAV